MLTYLRSLVHSFHTRRISAVGKIPAHGGSYPRARGFTLIELLVVMAIIGIISSVVFFEYSKFDSQLLLRNLAYEVALSIREAQIYGVGVRGDGGTTPSFETQYGVIFLRTPAGEDRRYRLFLDVNKNGQFDSTIDTVLQTFMLSRTHYVKNLCTVVGATETCGRDRLSVYFRRPFPDGNSWAQTGAATPVTNANLVKIVVGSMRDAASERKVVITQTGQIYIE